MREGREIHRNSDALVRQLTRKIDHSIKGTFERLDVLQEDEVISPFLAETIRDMVYQLTEEDPKRAQRLATRCIGNGPKFMASELEDGGGNYRLRKSAELVAEMSKGVVKPEDIIMEYYNWQNSDD